MKKVLVFGTFDGIHPGHLDFFRQAREHGDYLTVVVGRDETVRKIKGKYPKRNENERIQDLLSQDLVDEAILGDLQNPYRVIEEIKPDVICLGYDQNSFTKDLAKHLKQSGLDVEVRRMKPYEPEVYHSSKLN